MNVVGGYSGKISGTVSYNGVQSGALRITLHNGSDMNAPAVGSHCVADYRAYEFKSYGPVIL